jgi:Tfp pilus assembly protein PilV
MRKRKFPSNTPLPSTHTQPGLSMLIAVLLISVIVTFSVGVTTLVIDSYRQAGNVRQSSTAYFAAEGALEQALMTNKMLADQNDAIGISMPNLPIEDTEGAPFNAKYSISGTAAAFPVANRTVNGKYTIPLAWTGTAPWTGEGALPGSGGCSPFTPPTRQGTGINKTISLPNPYGSGNISLNEEYHPCNWGRLPSGQKVSLPLYGLNTSGQPVTFTDFTLRLRTPCQPNSIGGAVEACLPSNRLDLNCYDKGDEDIICISDYDGDSIEQNKRGEVVALWQIDAEDVSGIIKTILPYENVIDIGSGGGYQTSLSPIDTELYEGKINSKKLASIDPFEVLTDSNNGLQLDDAADPNPKPETNIATFLGSHTKPVLKLSVINSLNACDTTGLCVEQFDSPNSLDYNSKNMPYLEYQLVLNNLPAGVLPASLENVISAEGRAGAFSHLLQVKIPHDTSTLEYVIQQ